MSFPHPYPSDSLSRRRKRVTGIHVCDTEARTLEEACDIIAGRQLAAKRSANYDRQKPRTLRQQFSDAAGRSRLLKYRGEISLAPVGGISHNTPISFLPKDVRREHPLRGLSRAQKRDRARVLYASGLWGWKDRGYRTLARAFDVPFLTMVIWLRGINAPL